MVMAKAAYSDPEGRATKRPNSVETISDFYKRHDVGLLATIHLLIRPLDGPGETAPVGATRSHAFSAIDYKMTGPNRKIAYQFVIDRKPVRLYFEGKESGEDVLAFIRRELNVLPHATAYLQSGDLKIYLDRKVFASKKNYYEEKGLTDLAGNMRIAADVNALVRITKGREASVQVGLEEA